MKKNRIYFIILLVLVAVAAYFILTNKSGTIKQELRDFAIEDTAAVDKIFMADKTGSQVLLERKSPDQWTVNGSEPARQDGINLLLTTMKTMEVRSPVGKAARDYIIKEMSASGTKVEIYQHGALFKTFYVGGPTQDQLGTFMYLKNSSVPFIMHIPGFDGYLSPRFSTREIDWKTKSIFAYNRGDIESLTIQNALHPDQSFTIKKADEGKYQLLKFPSGEIQSYKDSGTIYAYLASYQFINYEKPLSGMPPSQVDSVLKVGPVMIIEGNDVKGKKTTVKLYIKPADPNIGFHYDESGKMLPSDPDRMMARINQDTGLVVVQYFSFDKLMKTLDELKKGDKK
jgi:hypothetical protein